MTTLPPINLSTETDRLVKFIQETFKKTNKSTAVIALSGGIDSAVSFALTVRALGTEHVEGFYLPAKNSNPHHLKDTQELIKVFDLPESNFHIIPIKGVIQKCWRGINKQNITDAGDHRGSPLQEPRTTNHEPRTARLRLANLSARIRMMIIYDQAKALDALVVGTENYSEHLLGYFTRFGDEASDIEPIRHLYKTQVIKLAKFLQIPQVIIDKPPSADLWSGQTDAAELGFTYELADPILYAIDICRGEVLPRPSEAKGEGGSSPDMLSHNFDPKLVAAVIHQIEIFHFKHQVPYLPKKFVIP